MDRRSRRFVPSSEGLEGRQLMATAAANAVNPLVTAPTGVQVDGSAAVGQTIEAKRHHITNLPYFIGLLNKDGAVPQPAVQNIQNDLFSTVGRLHQANSSLVSSFNLDLRKAQSYESITPITAANLNRDFGAILISAGVSPATTVDLQSQMTKLVQYDATTQPNSMNDVTNDYATVLELATDSGRPLVYPNAPTLLGTDHNGETGGIPITHNNRPSLTGSYTIGTDIQIVDLHNRVVLGQVAVDSTNGSYTVRFHEILPDGIYKVRVRAEDAGYVSDPSPYYTFMVATPKAKK